MILHRPNVASKNLIPNFVSYVNENRSNTNDIPPINCQFSGSVLSLKPMNKTCLSIICLLFISITVFPVDFSVLAGGSLSKYYATEQPQELSFSNRSGIFIGAKAAIDLSGQFRLSAGIILGSRNSGSAINARGESPLNAEYKNSLLQFPLLIETDLSKKSPVYFFAGPRLVFFLMHQLQIEPEDEFDIITKTNKIAFDIEAGIGYRINIGKLPFFIELKYIKGMSSIHNNIDSDYGITMDSIQLNVGYTFLKGK